MCTKFSECAALCKRGSDCGDSVFVGLPARRDVLAVAAAAQLTLPAGEMEEEPGEYDGDALSPRDAVAAGEDFVDLFCPLLCLRCGEDEEGNQVSVQAVAVGEVQGKLLIAVPAAAWHRKVAKRSVPRGFMTKVFAAETAVCTVQDRGSEVEGQVVRIWLGYCEPSAESALEISDGWLPSGESLLPFVEALAEIWQAQVAAGSTSAQTANEAPAVPQDWAERFATMERSLAQLSASLRGGSHAPPVAEPVAPAPQPVAATKAPRKAAPKVQAGPATQDFPGLDQGVVAAAIAAGVERQALSEMSRLVSSGPLTRLRSKHRARRVRGGAPTSGGGCSDPRSEHTSKTPGPRRTGSGCVGSGASEVSRFSRRPELKCEGLPAREGFGCKRRLFSRGLLEHGQTQCRRPSGASGIFDHIAAGTLRPHRATDERRFGSIHARCWVARGYIRARLARASEPCSGLSDRGSFELGNRRSPRLSASRASRTGKGQTQHCTSTSRSDVSRSRLMVARSRTFIRTTPPNGAFKRHDAPASSTDPVYSRLLDPRWAEIALSRLRDEADFLDKRQKLSTRHTPSINKDTSEPNGEGSERPPRRPPRKPQPKADA